MYYINILKIFHLIYTCIIYVLIAQHLCVKIMNPWNNKFYANLNKLMKLISLWCMQLIDNTSLALPFLVLSMRLMWDVNVFYFDSSCVPHLISRLYNVYQVSYFKFVIHVVWWCTNFLWNAKSLDALFTLSNFYN